MFKLKVYDTLRVLPRQARAAGAAATTALAELLTESDELLGDRIDPLIWQFRESNPDFYHKYQVARSMWMPQRRQPATPPGRNRLWPARLGRFTLMGHNGGFPRGNRLLFLKISAPKIDEPPRWERRSWKNSAKVNFAAFEPLN